MGATRRVASIIAAALFRLIILIAAYFGSIAPASFMSTRPITVFDYFSGDLWAWNPGYWLTQGHLILILLFPAAAAARQFLGRRDALMAGFLAWGVTGLLLGAVALWLGNLLTTGALPAGEVTASFIVAMAAAEFLLWRGLSHRGPRLADVPLAAAVFAILFNVLTFDLDPDLAGARLFIQTVMFAAGSGIAAMVLGIILRPFIGRAAPIASRAGGS